MYVLAVIDVADAAEVRAYSFESCSALARNWPDYALKNVNNYAFFALLQYLPRLRQLPAGPSPQQSPESVHQ